MKITLSKPHMFEGKEYAEIDMDLDGLTGNDIEDAQNILTIEKNATSALPEFSKAYCAHIASRAAKLPVEMIRSLPVFDYNKVTGAVQDFLLLGAL